MIQKPMRFLEASKPETVKKYHSKSKIKRSLLQRYFCTLLKMALSTGEKEVFEIGCGEGQVAALLMEYGFHVAGCDIDENDIAHAQRSIGKLFSCDVSAQFRVCSVYDIANQQSPITICCEVLEHLEQPEKALDIILHMADPYFILTVPHEPFWCILNILSLRNLKRFGNTPGHINHWSKKRFIRFVKSSSVPIDILSVQCPLPFILLLGKVHRSDAD